MSFDLSKLSREQLEKLIIEQAKNITNLTTKQIQLEKDLDEAKAKIRELELERGKYIQLYDNATTNTKLLQYEKFCPKTEKSNDTINDIEEASEKTKKVHRKKGRKEGSKNWINKVLENREPDETRILDDTTTNSNGDHICPNCKSVLIKIGEDVSYLVESHTDYKIIKIVRPKYKCENCNTFIQHETTNAFNHSCVTPSFAADIIDKKCNLLVPLYRQAQYFEAKDLPISEQTLCKIMIDSGEMLIPIYNKLKEKLLTQEVIHIDETTFKVIDIKERKTSYMFIYASGEFTLEQIRIYHFNKSRETNHVIDYLRDYNGYISVDKYAGYNELIELGKKVQYCIIHARRKFNDIVKLLTKEQLNDSETYKIKNLIDELYIFETKFKEKKLGPEAIQKARNSKEYLEVVNNIKNEINTAEALENSKLAQAINYMRNGLDLFFTYLDSGYVRPDNNKAERTVKPFAIGRKNFLFSSTTKGAMTTGILFSITQTAKANGLRPEEYLAYVLENINKKHVDDLLPWSENIPTHLKIPKK